MVNAINSSAVFSFKPDQNFESYSLTDDEKKTVQNIISKYDAKNMTAESMRTMMDEIKSSGIKPSKDIKEMLDTAGFKPPEKPEGAPPDRLQSSDEMPDFLTSFLEKQKSGELTEDDLISLIKNLQNSGSLAQGNLIDKLA